MMKHPSVKTGMTEVLYSFCVILCFGHGLLRCKSVAKLTTINDSCYVCVTSEVVVHFRRRAEVV